MNRRQFLLAAGLGATFAEVSSSQDAAGQKKKARQPRETRPDGPMVFSPFSPMPVGTSAQLFVERSIIREAERVWFTLHPGEKHPGNPLLRADRDWEGWRIKTYGNAIFDEEEKVFKLWYESEPPPGYFRPNFNYSYYAVSGDGVRWEKPLVGTIPSLKSGFRHNVVLEGWHANVIKDDGERDRAHRYKAVVNVRPSEGGDDYPHTVVSPDGLSWSRFSKKPLVDGIADVPTAYFDEHRRIWVMFFRRLVVVRGQERRCFCMTASKDFVNWSEPQLVFVPDYSDDAGSLGRIERVRSLLYVPDNPTVMNTQYYGIGAYAAECCTVAFPWILTVNNAGRRGGVDGPIEIQLAASRDLVNWERHFRTPCIPRGTAGEWDSGLFYTQSQAIRYNDEIWLYYSGSNFTHGIGDHVPDRNKATISIGLVKWKSDRFVSVDAGVEGGTLTTVPLSHTGRYLELNARVRHGGSIRVEFLDPAGKPIQEAGRSAPCTGDSLKNRVAWGNEHIVERVKGKPVSVRFHLRSAELYSFAFRA